MIIRIEDVLGEVSLKRNQLDYSIFIFKFFFSDTSPSYILKHFSKVTVESCINPSHTLQEQTFLKPMLFIPLQIQD